MIETTWEWLVANPGLTTALLALDLAALAVVLRWSWADAPGVRGRIAQVIATVGLSLISRGGNR